MQRAVRIVAMGGGTGLSLLLKGLSALKNQVEVTAVVAVSDDGGSSGRLRWELGLPALGDARACLSALVGEGGWASLLEHRFPKGATLQGHALGNLLLAAACEQSGSLESALSWLGERVGARGRVLPSTCVAPVLVATLDSGEKVYGQSILSERSGAVDRVELFPQLVPPSKGVLRAIDKADLVVLGPGSLFSSVIAAALPAGVPRALANSRAKRIFVLNQSPQPGETGGMDGLDHVLSLRDHLGSEAFDTVLFHSSPSSASAAASSLKVDTAALRELGLEVEMVDIASENGRLHHPDKLAAAVWGLAQKSRSKTSFRQELEVFN